MSHALGIMQGRLSPPEGGRIQSFPLRTWREEFSRAKLCGLDRIEWIIEDPDWRENPLMTPHGREEIRRLSAETGVEVRSVCADLFMTEPLHSAPAETLERRSQALRCMVEACGAAGIEHIDIPFVDASAIATQEAFETVAGLLRRAAAWADSAGLLLCLEASLEPSRFKDLLEAIGHARVRANHDIGNSASLGFTVREEFSALGPWIACVHIKDRKRDAGTVPLGTGDADFESTFRELRKVGYAGHFVLQAARGASGEELTWSRQNIAFARRLIATLG